MDGATLQAKVYAGYAKAALRIGLPTDQYRPTTASNPIASGNKLRTLTASFNAEDMRYSKPNKYGHPTWFGLFDGRLTQAGDYLTNATDGTFFIAGQQTNLPILLVQTNRVASFARQQQQTGVGALSYGGTTAANETVLATGWPCSILQGPKGEKGEVALPGDVRNPWWLILVPAITGVTLRSGDIVTDDLARKYIISSAELTDLGWRLTAMQAQT